MVIRLTPVERRNSIVTAAVPVFARKGFAGTTTREIAEAAGVSEALVFKHFATKTALYDAIIQHCRASDPRFERLSELVPSTASLVDIVQDVSSYFAGLGESSEEDKSRHRLFLRSLSEDGEFARVGLGVFAEMVLPIFARAYEAAGAAGDLIEHPPAAETAFWMVARMQLMMASLSLNRLDADIPALSLNATVPCLLRAIGLREAAIQSHYKNVPARLPAAARA